MKQVLAITRKELRGYFGSPMALIFLGAFLAVTFYSFFWVDTFFERGIADVRPLFRWMPVLLIFLVASLTMRQWSEEQRGGTLEILLTLPVSPIRLVLGKFLAVLVLVALALALTFSLPLSISMVGNLDWGPVFGGYLAALLLAGAYAAVGLFISSRTDNQIVALISTTLLCGFFYLIGSEGVTAFFGDQVGEVLRAVGTGSRFESIQRGVIDLRDLFYYLAFAGAFLTLNVLSLLSKRWSESALTLPQRKGATAVSVLLALNLIVGNVWLYPLRGLRVDLTEQQEYSLSPVTRELLASLEEPLLIRGYFSERTHPLLAPLVPQVRDMLEEYRIASGGNVQVEIVDPAQDPEKEAEAVKTYGINPTPFQVSGRYEASVINSYFDILIRYGDQHLVLSFQDLIEVQSQRNGQPDVRLRNLEYDLTRSIKKVAYGFQSIDGLLASLTAPAKLTLYITPDLLPEELADVPPTIQKVAQEFEAQSKGKFVFQVVDPTQPGGSVGPKELAERYGIQAIPVSLFSNEGFYLYMVLEMGEQSEVVYPSGNYEEADIRSAIESALRRASPGFLKVVGLWTPPATSQDMYGQMQQSVASWEQLSGALGEEYNVRTMDLSSGVVPPDVDVLVVVAPQGMSEMERYAIDQYLMRGGTVIVAGGRYSLGYNQMSGLYMNPLLDGLAEMLGHYGIYVDTTLVMDAQNEQIAAPTTRQVGGTQVQVYEARPYPYFVDIRADGMATRHPIVSNLQAVTLHWTSPITVDAARTAGQQVETLLHSSKNSWVQSGPAFTIQSNEQLYGEYGFPVITPTQTYSLAVAVQGSFESYYKDRPSPFTQTVAASASTIITSAPTARLVVVGSAEFLDDMVFQISAQISQDRYLNNLKLIQNAVAWATEDNDLMTIRARGTTSRIIAPLGKALHAVFEWGNYLIGLVALLVVGGVWSLRRRSEKPMALLAPVSEGSGERSDPKAEGQGGETR